MYLHRMGRSPSLGGVHLHRMEESISVVLIKENTLLNFKEQSKNVI